MKASFHLYSERRLGKLCLRRHCAQYCTINGFNGCYNFLHMPPDLNDLKKSIDKQNTLLEENNRMLHKLKRYHTVTFWMTMLWYALLIGLPFAVYYYIIGPYIQALGFSDGQFSAESWQDIPGFRQFEHFFGMSEEKGG